MSLSLDTKDLAQMSRSPWAVALVLAGIIGLVMWLLVDRVITREDDILEQGARVERELASTREELSAGLRDLSVAFAESDRQMTSRAERWIAALARLSRISAAQCYAAANGDPTAQQRCERADVGN